MIKTLKHAPHELAKLFPPMESEQLRELAEDIKKNGLLELIILLDGKVLDGVHRQKACTMAGVEPRYVPWEELNDSATASGPLNFVMSRNLKRRHLTASQRASCMKRVAFVSARSTVL